MLYAVLDTCPAPVWAVVGYLDMAQPQRPLYTTLHEVLDTCPAPVWEVVGYLDMAPPQRSLYTTFQMPTLTMLQTELSFSP